MCDISNHNRCLKVLYGTVRDDEIAAGVNFFSFEREATAWLYSSKRWRIVGLCREHYQIKRVL